MDLKPNNSKFSILFNEIQRIFWALKGQLIFSNLKYKSLSFFTKYSNVTEIVCSLIGFRIIKLII